MDLPPDLLALLRQPSHCFLATTMPDGSPQLTQTWGDTDGQHVLINTVRTHQKVRNVVHDPRVAVSISDTADPTRYYAVRGKVVKITAEGARSTSRRSRSAISACRTPGTAVATRSGSS